MDTLLVKIDDYFKKTISKIEDKLDYDKDSIFLIGELFTLLYEKENINIVETLYDNYSRLILNFDIKELYETAFDLSIKSMKSLNWNVQHRNRLRYNQHICIPVIQNRYENYDIDNVSNMLSLLSKKRLFMKDENKKITVTMTSCKRLPLFIKTVSSFLNCCLDKELIDEWFVIDDNSSNEDRETMRTLFPFIKFIFKSQDDKGHARSMNMLLNQIKTPYIFHLEDDWLFFRKEKYLSTCIRLIELDKNYGQCLLNKNYGEDENAHNIIGGFEKIVGETIYYEHQYLKDNDLLKFINNNIGKQQCVYWPHFSFRVGLTKIKVLKDIGNFNENTDHFELEYAHRYTKNNYKTIFMDNIFCLHIGRKTSERFDKTKLNAYDLNNVKQFGEINTPSLLNLLPLPSEKEERGESKEVILELDGIKQISPAVLPLSIKEVEKPNPIRIDTRVINLKRRTDRLKKFIENNHTKIHQLCYKIEEAVDGYSLPISQKVMKLFQHNDYNYRKGIIGVALSNIKLWYELSLSDHLDCMLIFEDDTEVCEDFINKLIVLIKSLPKDWDVLFLGHHLYPQFKKETDRENIIPVLENWDEQKCRKYSMGSCGSYLISRQASKKMLEHLKLNGMKNAIDWELFNIAKDKNIYYSYPHICYSECANSGKVDTDIQNNLENLGITKEVWIKHDIEYWMRSLDCKGVLNLQDNFKNKDYEEDEKSIVMYTNKLPSRDILLSGVTFLVFEGKDKKGKKMKKENIDKKLNMLPVKYYKIFTDCYVIVSETKITRDILLDITFEGYLNMNKPV